MQRDEKGLEEIDEARRLRDKDRMMYMEEVHYDAAIINAGTLDEFLERSEKLFKELYGNYGSTKR